MLWIYICIVIRSRTQREQNREESKIRYFFIAYKTALMAFRDSSIDPLSEVGKSRPCGPHHAAGYVQHPPLYRNFATYIAAVSTKSHRLWRSRCGDILAKLEFTLIHRSDKLRTREISILTARPLCDVYSLSFLHWKVRSLLSLVRTEKSRGKNM